MENTDKRTVEGFGDEWTRFDQSGVDPAESEALFRRLETMMAAGMPAGYTLVPLELYWKNNRVKLRIGLAKGKKDHDKRDTSKERDWAREKSRLMKHSKR